MIVAFLALCLLLLAASVHLLRTRSATWPVGLSVMLTGLASTLVGGAVLAAVTVGRGTWNSWAAGTPHRETFTLSLILFVLPALLVVASLCLIVGGLNARRRRRTNGSDKARGHQE